MTNKKEVAQKVFEAFWKNEPHPCNVDGYEIANALREVVNQLKYIGITEKNILELCDELENL